MSRSARAIVPVLAFAAVLVPAAVAQVPEEFSNLQVLPKDISREELIETMRGFSFALGVRCEYCHVREADGNKFPKDDKQHKLQARFMISMMNELNRSTLAQLPGRSEPAVQMQCKTCHRGRPKPLLLSQELQLALEAGGIDSTLSHLGMLREHFENRGAYDFGEWELNVFAERLADEGRNTDAIAVYLANAEQYPESVAIMMSLAQLYEREGDFEAAIAQLEHVLKLNPEFERASQKLEELRQR